MWLILYYLEQVTRVYLLKHRQYRHKVQAVISCLYLHFVLRKSTFLFHATAASNATSGAAATVTLYTSEGIETEAQ